MSDTALNKSAEAPGEDTPKRSTLLTPLTSIRFFAALHIFVFHIQAMHRGAGEQMQYAAFDLMPAPLSRLIERGYYSTSLFFLLSGFILAYLYIGADRQMTRGKREFWIARLTRIYPLHLVILGLVAPLGVIISLFVALDQSLNLFLSAICNALLVQAWVPPYALSWNFPTWALSTVVFFYLAFPVLVKIFARMQRWQMGLLLAVLPVISLIPTVIFLGMGGVQAYPPFSFWNEFVMRTPLLWLPHFMMGMLLSCLFGVHRCSDAWRDQRWRRFAWGDLAFAVLCVLLTIDQRWTFRGVEYTMPNFIMRHGTLAPLYLVLIHDLARNRGLLGRLLDWRPLGVLGDSSFSIFMLQTPAMVLMVGISMLGLNQFPTLQLVCSILLCLVISLASTRYFEKPFAGYLRAKWIKPSKGPSIPAPHSRPTDAATPHSAALEGGEP